MPGVYLAPSLVSTIALRGRLALCTDSLLQRLSWRAIQKMSRVDRMSALCAGVGWRGRRWHAPEGGPLMSQPTSASKLSLIHLKRLSRTSDGERPSLLLLLHGVGSNEQDLFALAPQFDSRFVVLSVRAPLVWGPDSFAWFTVRFQADQPIINAKELDASQTRLAN